MCDQRGPFGGDLTCTRPDHPEEPRGHVFSASDAPDRHDKTEASDD